MRLLKREIKTVNARVLNTRYCELLDKGETLPANEITVAEAKEILWIEDELHRRLIKYIGRDFYPPDRVKEQAPSNSIAAALGRAKTKIEPNGLPSLNFKVIVTSSIGSKAAVFNVKASSKDKAEIEADKEIRKLGLVRATYKIS